MSGPAYIRSPFSLAKRVKIRLSSGPLPTTSCPRQAKPAVLQSQARTVYQSRQPWHGIMGKNPAFAKEREDDQEYDDKVEKAAEEERGMLLPLREFKLPDELQQEVDGLRLPRSVQLTYLAPLRRRAQHGIPTADLQLRSYSVRNLELAADFSMRAAYYLKLAAKGPVPLPRIVERYTVPKSNFIHKKTQENFERVTLRRLIQIQDGHPETVGVWLGFLQKYMYYGVGIKANVWDYSGIEVGEEMDREAERQEASIKEKLALFGRRKDLVDKRETERIVHDRLFKGAYGSLGVMGSTQYNEV